MTLLEFFFSIIHFLLFSRNQYETVPDIPVQVLDDLFLELIGGDKYLKLNPNQEQDLLDLLEECTVIHIFFF